MSKINLNEEDSKFTRIFLGILIFILYLSISFGIFIILLFVGYPIYKSLGL